MQWDLLTLVVIVVVMIASKYSMLGAAVSFIRRRHRNNDPRCREQIFLICIRMFGVYFCDSREILDTLQAG